MIYEINEKNVETLDSCTICDSGNMAKISDVCDHRGTVFLTTTCCQNCGHVFRSTRPKFDWFLNSWSKRKNDKEDIIVAQTADPEKENRRYDRYKNLALVLKSCVKNKNMLDVGCGPGAGLKAFVDAGWEVTGIEPDPIRAAVGVEYHGLNIKNCTIDEHEESNKYDVATILHVLEHTHEPKQFLKSVVDKVKDDGFIYIEVPELFDFISFKDSLYLEHMQNFTRYTLQKIGLDIGLMPKKTFVTKTHPTGHNHMAILFQKQSKDSNYSILNVDKASYGAYINEGWRLDLNIPSPMHDKHFAASYNNAVREIYRRPTDVDVRQELSFCVKNITNVDITCEMNGLRYDAKNNKIMVIG